ncbi:hypothetical protein BJEO58_02070 [Brevibacterium jeotgali]|uniref:DUF4190 domain-containing protein n=1 Tax=Brevibacterium jeotgali TaxID=1262550 RepID=A0A2H1L6D9_9MICO|nr:hypothetical protein FB108_2930 [Brevibacterium jeotgali]SMY12474.1 hypothetical protein BJEO58_02070 [Brevibacterium jeotgali]
MPPPCGPYATLWGVSNPSPVDDKTRIDPPRDTDATGKGTGAPDGGSDKDPEKPSGPQRTVVKYGLALTVLLAGAILCSMLSLPLVIVSGVLALGAMVCAVICLVAGIRAGQVAQAIVTGIIGFIVAGYVLVSAISTVFIWDIRADFEACMADSITEQATAVCQNDYNEQVGDWFERLTGQPLPGSQAD